MAGKLQVRVITPDSVVFEGSCDSVQYPAEDGLVGVMPGHAPMITTVDSGPLVLKEGASETRMFVSRGFCQVRDNELRFAVDSGESEDTIDLDRAKKAAERAQDRLRHRQSEVDYLRAQYALRRALMRIQAKSPRL